MGYGGYSAGSDIAEGSGCTGPPNPPNRPGRSILAVGPSRRPDIPSLKMLAILTAIRAPNHPASFELGRARELLRH
jgi:hypothetical protein